MKVPVELDIDAATKHFKINVKSPPVSELLKKEAGLEKGTGDHKKIKVGNLAIEQVIKIAKTKLPDALEKDLKSMVKTIVGSCVSLGILVESKSPVEVESEIEEGKYNKEIKEEKTEVSHEKELELNRFFKELKDKQEAAIKAEEVKEEKPEEVKEEVKEEKKEAKPAAKSPAKPAAKSPGKKK